MNDTLCCSKPFKILDFIDESSREILAIEVDTSLPVSQIISTLEQLGEIYELPQAMHMDRLELRSVALLNEVKARVRSYDNPTRQIDPERLHRVVQPDSPA